MLRCENRTTQQNFGTELGEPQRADLDWHRDQEHFPGYCQNIFESKLQVKHMFERFHACHEIELNLRRAFSGQVPVPKRDAMMAESSGVDHLLLNVKSYGLRWLERLRDLAGNESIRATDISISGKLVREGFDRGDNLSHSPAMRQGVK